MKSLIFCLFAILLLSGCDTELELPTPSANHRVVLLGELTANDSMFIRAGRSIGLKSDGLNPELIRDLAVTVRDSTGSNIALTEREDYRSYGLYTVPFTSPETVVPGHHYTITANHAQLGKAVSSIMVPQPFTASLSSSNIELYNGDSVLKVDMDLGGLVTPEAQFVVEVIRQPASVFGYFFFNSNQYSIKDDRRMYDSLKAAGETLSEYYDTSYSGMYTRWLFHTTDQTIDNASGAGQGRLFGRIFLQANSFSGGKHHTQILVPLKANYVYEEIEYAQLIINIKSVAPDYYLFLKSYETYDPYSTAGANGNVSQVKGNVTGGYGMIGGVYKREFRFLYKVN